MTDSSFRKILGLNQQTYQRLRLALSLHLRRQVFVAVCDDLELRDRLAAQLAEDLTSKPRKGQSKQETQPSSRLISLNLDLSDPNPIVQIAQWLSELQTRTGDRRLSIPSFQILGIEHLTQESAAIQRLFFTHLQGIERSLPMLEAGLILWMPKPWYHALPQSAPEFWRCRTAVFEFVGDPKPLPPVNPEPQIQRLPQPVISQHANGFEPVAAESEVPPQEAETLLLQTPVLPEEDPWMVLAPELDRQMEEEDSDDLPSSNGDERSLHALVSELSKAPIQIVKPPRQVEVKTDQHSSPDKATQAQTLVREKPVAVTHVAVTQAAKPPAQAAKEEPVKAGAVALLTKTETVPPVRLEPLTLGQQIEQLHQQQAPPAELAEAYRLLGNLYRDRIEQGDVSPQNLMTAIQAYEQVLVWLHETSALWTDVLNDLGNLYWMLSRYASSAEQSLSHLQQGIQAYQLALTKLNVQIQPSAYAMIQNNLGAAYADLARYQDPTENLQRSVQSYQQALRYRKSEEDPQRYASTQNNLGTAYWNLAQHQQPEVYLKQAIAAYSEALNYYSPEQEPLSYAMIQNNLGTAYWNLAQHERTQDWLRLALGAYKIALRYRTLETAPAAFAATQNNLGTAHWHMASNTKNNPDLRLDSLHQAISAYEATLVAAEQLAAAPQPVPLNFDLFATHNNLGLAHYQIATDPQILLEADALSAHLEIALHHHLQALQGWQQKPDFRQTALSCIIQTIRATYSQCGLTGQNRALSKVPGYLLPEILPKL